MSWSVTENDWDSQGLGTMLVDEPARLFKLKRDNTNLVVGLILFCVFPKQNGD